MRPWPHFAGRHGGLVNVGKLSHTFDCRGAFEQHQNINTHRNVFFDRGSLKQLQPPWYPSTTWLSRADLCSVRADGSASEVD